MGSPALSAKWNTRPSEDSCTSLRASTLASSVGPNDVIVARSGMPFPWPPRAKNSVGQARPSHFWPTSSARFVTFSPGSPALATPDRSPLMSAANTGTPSAESCSAISWRVLVLPVPVAPATRPCRLTIASGMRTPASGCAVAVDDQRAELESRALERVALLHRCQQIVRHHASRSDCVCPVWVVGSLSSAG